MRGYAGRTPTKAPNWHGLVVYDVLFNNLTTGLFMAATIGELVAPATLSNAATIAYPVALAFLLADLVCLVLDLGDPFRFHHMLRIFKAKSPMSIGTWALVSFSLPAGLLALMAIFDFGSLTGLTARRIVGLAGLIPALAASMYKGVLFSTTAQPGWRDGRWLGGWLSTSAILLGCFLLAVIAIIRGQPAALVPLRPALVALLAVNAVNLALVARDVKALGRAPLIGGLVGSLAPFALVLVGGSVPIIAAAVLALAGAYILRHALVMLPHEH